MEQRQQCRGCSRVVGGQDTAQKSSGIAFFKCLIMISFSLKMSSIFFSLFPNYGQFCSDIGMLANVYV